MSLSNLLTLNSKKLPETNWFSRQDNLGRAWVVLISLLVVAIFSVRELSILILSDWPHLYGVVGVPIIRWEEIILYLPFATEFTWSNWFPVAPVADNSVSGLTLFPQISIVLYQILYKTVGLGDIDLFLIILRLFFSLVSFWLIYAIFRIYIHKSWALLFAFLGVFYFPGFSSFGYAVELLVGQGRLIDSASIVPPEISRSPFPGITLPFFLIVFYLTIKSNRLDQKRLCLLSIFWGLQIYIYAFNFIAGILFWFMWLVYACYISDKGIFIKKLTKTWSVSLAIIMAVSSPYIIKLVFYQSQIDQQFVESVTWVSNNTVMYTSNWGGIISYLLPTVFVLCVIFLFRGDYYELFYKFTPVFIAIGVDLVIGSMHFIFEKTIDPTLYHDRISGIAFRYFFFIPLFYFLGNPYKTTYSIKNKQIINFAERLHIILQQTLIKRRIILCGLGVLFIGGIEILGGVRYFLHHEQEVATQMKVMENEISIVQTAGIEEGNVAFENIPTNFINPLLTKHNSLLVSKYGNQIKEESILKRLVLFAKLYQWNEDKFIKFMLPSDKFNRKVKTRQSLINQKDMEEGLGYWLLKHQRSMQQGELEQYKKHIQSQFRLLELNQLVRQFNLKAALSNTPIQVEGNIRVSVKKIDSYYLNTFST